MSTTIVPGALYRLQEENKREIEDNAPEEGEVVKPTTQEMCDINNWVHHSLSLLKQGTTKHAPGAAKDGEEVEEEELLAREVAKDPWEARLKPIVEDAKTTGSMPAWILR